MSESVRALLAQWRANAESSQQRAKQLSDDGHDTWSNGYSNRAAALVTCAEQLEAALTPLADLEAEMRRFAEAMKQAGLAIVAEQALAWAERLKALR